MLTLPNDFTQYMQAQLGDEWPAFLEALQQPSPVSIQYNHAKTEGFLHQGTPVPWNPSGLYLPERPSFTLDPDFQAGRYYVQEAGSMFVAWILQQLKQQHSFHTALDMCAAPGGKTTLLLNYLPDDCTVVANEVIKTRFGILRDNLSKWGRANAIATSADSKLFAPLSDTFDLILADAPCSGEGLFRKQADAAQEWSAHNVQLCESRQKRILQNCVPLLREGGYLIYSTCTYNHWENDDQVDWLQQEYGLEKVDLAVPAEWQIQETRGGWQFYPHCTQSEGFFAAVLRKPEKQKPTKKQKPAKLRYFERLAKKEQAVLDPWLNTPKQFQFLQTPKNELLAVPKNSLPLLEQLSQYLPRISPGIPLGMIKGKDLVPAHELALSVHLSEKVARLEADEAIALAFLRREDISLTGKTAPGWYCVSWKGHGLGWVKVLPKRVNNYYPKHWRVRK